MARPSLILPPPHKVNPKHRSQSAHVKIKGQIMSPVSSTAFHSFPLLVKPMSLHWLYYKTLPLQISSSNSSFLLIRIQPTWPPFCALSPSDLFLPRAFALALRSA